MLLLTDTQEAFADEDSEIDVMSVLSCWSSLTP